MFIERFKTKKKLIVLSLLSLALAACGDAIPDEDTVGISPQPPSSPQETTPIDTESFEQEEFLFVETSSLTADLHVNARKVFFRFGSLVKINGFNLSIEADEIHFEKQTSLIAYKGSEYPDCKAVGKNSGSIEITANKVFGKPFVDLAGQNAGQVGIYSASDAKAPLEKSHTKLSFQGKSWFKGCLTNIKGYPKDAPHLLKHKKGGAPGRLYLDVLDHSTFSPLISERVSHSSYEAIVEGGNKNISWWRTVPRGPNGQPGKLCYLIGSEYLCK